jgi:hypothetical protein
VIEYKSWMITIHPEDGNSSAGWNAEKVTYLLKPKVYIKLYPLKPKGKNYMKQFSEADNCSVGQDILLYS